MSGWVKLTVKKFPMFFYGNKKVENTFSISGKNVKLKSIFPLSPIEKEVLPFFHYSLDLFQASVMAVLQICSKLK